MKCNKINGGQMKIVKYISTILVSLILTINFALAEKWDMALAYGAGNFHSANATELQIM